MIGRLAPSPTGALHLGNARSFLIAWLSARQQHGKLILRIEDIDSPRIKAWAVDQTLADLKWLGLDWDYGPDIGGPHAPYIQTERRALYRDLLDRLIACERVYPCTCSRSDIAAAASAPHESGEPPIYPGTCSSRCAAEASHLNPADFAWRYRASSDVFEWNDSVVGLQSGSVRSRLGDFVIAKGDGTPAYQLAVVADDHAMQVTEVVRGNDLIASTFRQLDLMQAFGFDPPHYAHLPLMVGTDGRRLAKRHGDTRLSWFREQGFTSRRIVGYLASTLGLLPSDSEAMPHDLPERFKMGDISSEPTVVDVAQLVKQLA